MPSQKNPSRPRQPLQNMMNSARAANKAVNFNIGTSVVGSKPRERAVTTNTQDTVQDPDEEPVDYYDYDSEEETSNLTAAVTGDKQRSHSNADCCEDEQNISLDQETVQDPNQDLLPSQDLDEEPVDYDYDSQVETSNLTAAVTKQCSDSDADYREEEQTPNNVEDEDEDEEEEAPTPANGKYYRYEKIDEEDGSDSSQVDSSEIQSSQDSTNSNGRPSRNRKLRVNFNAQHEKKKIIIKKD
jgi:hypothetical protein